MKKTFFVMLFLISNILIAQTKRASFGISLGLGSTTARFTEKANNAKITPSYGRNVYFPFQYKISEHFYAETGVGNYLVYYSVFFNNLLIRQGHGNLYIPLKAKYDIPLKDRINFFSGIGFTMDIFTVKETLTAGNDEMINEYTLHGKRNKFIIGEIGFKKTSSIQRIHQLSLHYFYGLHTIASGKIYLSTNPQNTSMYNYRGQFGMIQYTYWLRKKSKTHT
jgi:hypothetical protein